MGNRKQPFGYRMTLGEITILPEEAELVRFIFQGYSTGATLGELTKALCRQEIPYYEGRTWNKNMVSRILEDSRYIGEKGYAEKEVEEPVASSDFSRSNWCPGTVTNPEYIYLGDLEAGEHSITVKIPQGAPEGGSNSYWCISGTLIY